MGGHLAVNQTLRHREFDSLTANVNEQKQCTKTRKDGKKFEWRCICVDDGNMHIHKDITGYEWIEVGRIRRDDNEQ